MKKCIFCGEQLEEYFETDINRLVCLNKMDSSTVDMYYCSNFYVYYFCHNCGFQSAYGVGKDPSEAILKLEELYLKITEKINIGFVNSEFSDEKNISLLNEDIIITTEYTLSEENKQKLSVGISEIPDLYIKIYEE